MMKQREKGYLTKGITHESEPSRDAGTAHGRKRMGAAHMVGGADREPAGQ